MTEVPDGGPTERSRDLRVPLAAGAAVLLLAAGFGLGRVTAGDSEGDAVATTTVATGQGDDGYVQVDQNADYDVEDVVAVFPPIIVRDGEILDQEKGSPERALLEWWQAYQFSDVHAVEQLTSPETIKAIGEDNLRALITLPGPGLQGIEVIDADGSGDSASVNAALLNFQASEEGEPPPTKPTSSTPETFTMQREGGEWLFAETPFLETKLTTLPE